MRIRVEHGAFDENEVVLRCRELDAEMLGVLALLKERSARLSASAEGETHLLRPDDICYAESVDGKTFLYTLDRVLETQLSLARLLEEHGEAGFLRIGKSQMANLLHVSKLRSLPNSRIEITLKNGERLVVSRHYVGSLREKLGIPE